MVVDLGDDAEAGTHRRSASSSRVVARRSKPAAVACKILAVAAERLDLADDPRHRLADDELDVLGVEPFDERSRTDRVGEDPVRTFRSSRTTVVLPCGHRTAGRY